jgi:hypothetical protein
MVYNYNMNEEKVLNGKQSLYMEELSTLGTLAMKVVSLKVYLQA